jgi:hypothetical protein
LYNGTEIYTNNNNLEEKDKNNSNNIKKVDVIQVHFDTSPNEQKGKMLTLNSHLGKIFTPYK